MQRIPDNWYCRADDYKLAKVHFDTVQVLLEAPPTMKLGGNTGQVNFAGVDISNITGGVYNTKNLLQVLTRVPDTKHFKWISLVPSAGCSPISSPLSIYLAHILLLNSPTWAALSSLSTTGPCLGRILARATRPTKKVRLSVIPR
ncbi:hypothetical protein FS749_014408 [Ceratobasidium sp. UAMH 11750]|nr:hypothetical protein FS749_014408 [Ceratobasidium sp. UAMH 11750]